MYSFSSVDQTQLRMGGSENPENLKIICDVIYGWSLNERNASMRTTMNLVLCVQAMYAAASESRLLERREEITFARPGMRSGE